jgi:hypothetical protein
MHLLIGLGLFLWLFYGWLVGHWFARVLVFLLICAAFFLLDCIVFAAPGPGWKLFAILLLPLAGVAAWGISGIPIYVHRKRSYQITGAGWEDGWGQRRAAAGRSRRDYRSPF